MSWSVSDPDRAVVRWVSHQAPNIALVTHVTLEWIPELQQVGPFNRAVGTCVFQEESTGLVVLSFTHIRQPAFFAELRVSPAIESIVLLDLGRATRP